MRCLLLPPAWQARVASGEICPIRGAAVARLATDPELLALLESDMQENPWAYRILDDFVRSVRAIELKRPARTMTNARALPARKSPADKLVAAVEALESKVDVERVLRAAKARLAALPSPLADAGEAAGKSSRAAARFSSSQSA
jgi:hypothetical protein